MSNGSKPKTYHRSNAELRVELQEMASLLADLAAWAELPGAGACVHWYPLGLRRRVDRAIGLRDRMPLR